MMNLHTDSLTPLTFVHDGHQYMLDTESQQVYLIEEGDSEPVYAFSSTPDGFCWLLEPLYDGEELMVERDEKNTLISLFEAVKAALDNAQYGRYVE